MPNKWLSNALLFPVLLWFFTYFPNFIQEISKNGSGSNLQLVPMFWTFCTLIPSEIMLLKVENHWTLTGKWESNLWFFTILNLSNGAKTGKSKRVLKASHFFLLEKFQLFASQNNLNIVVEASYIVCRRDFYNICLTLCVDTLCTAGSNVLGVFAHTVFERIMLMNRFCTIHHWSKEVSTTGKLLKICIASMVLDS